MYGSEIDNFISYIKSNRSIDPWRHKIADSTRYKYRQHALKMRIIDSKLQKRVGSKWLFLVRNEEKEGIIMKYYKNPDTGFISPSRLYPKIREEYGNITLADVKAAIYKDTGYQVHKRPLKLKGRSNTQQVYEPLRYFQSDLIDMSNLSTSNRGYRYALNLVDNFTKYLFSEPLKSKDGPGTATAFREVINRISALRVATLPEDELHHRIVINSDNGSEFKNPFVRQVFEDENVVQTFNSPHSPQSNGLVERVNGTLKSMMFKYMHDSGSRAWVDVLQRFVKNYNESVHSTIKSAPVATLNKIETKGGTQEVERINSLLHAEKEDLMNERNLRQFPELNIGDKVRIILPLPDRKHGYNVQWTIDIYTIEKVIRRRNKRDWRYMLEQRKGLWKRDELLKITE